MAARAPIKVNDIDKFRGDNQSCVYKLYYNTVYVIVKAKDLYGSLRMIQKSMNQYMRGLASQMKPDNLYRYFFEYIKKHKNGTFRVDVVLEDANAYRLLMMEQRLLKKSRRDKKNLNNRISSYIPQWDPEQQQYNWIKKNEVLNYQRYKKNA